MGMFDDLIPQQNQPSGGMFDDLIPKKAAPVASTTTSTPAPTPAQPQGFNVLEASQAALSRQQAKRETETAAKAEAVPFEQLYKNQIGRASCRERV
jgi:hypothetical protein